MNSNKPCENTSADNSEDLSDLLADIMSVIPMYAFVKDCGDNFRYLYSSPMMSELYGRCVSEVTGKTDFELFDDPVVAQSFRNMDERVLRTGKNIRFREQVLDPSGVYHLLETTKRIIPRKNKPPFLLGMSFDVDKDYQKEEELQEYNKILILSCQAGCIYPWVWNLKDDRVEVSETSTGRMTKIGYMREDFLAALHPEDWEACVDKITAMRLGKIDSMRMSCRNKLLTGKYVWYEVVGEVYEFGFEGKPNRAIGVMRDITEEKLWLADRQAKLLAEESDRMKSTFIANMSHEIRTPLNAIVGFSSLITQAESEEEKREYLKIIESSNEFLLQLIGDILDISRIESGKMEFVNSDFLLSDLFKPLERTFVYRADPGVEVVFENDGKDYRVISEKTKLTQVLSNFLGNATKFTPSGSVRFGYEVREAGLYCYVKDTGVGINPDNRKTVFDRFVKLDSNKQGTGLGLSICKTIINILKGEIGVDSEPGIGSVFWFSIPCEITPVTR